MLTAERLKLLLSYNPNSGIFHHITDKGPQGRIWSLAGTVCKDGYIAITIDRKKHKAHRLAWLYVHGAWPEGQLDHKDRDKSNNRIDNLRPATRSQQIANTEKREGLSSKYKGVAWHKEDKIWRCAIVVNGVRHILGNFKSEEEAGKRYNEAALQYFGEYAKLNIINPAVAADAHLVEV